jgi:tellurite resistance protein TerC
MAAGRVDVTMHVTALHWTATAAVILGLFAFDLVFNARVPRTPTLRESAVWSAAYIGLAAAFGIAVKLVWGGGHAGEYYAGFVTEWALSVDNLFVFTIIMAGFAVPRDHQQKVLLIGILTALCLRGVFIALGAAAISAFSWVFYLFGIFLVYTAVNLFRGSGHESQAEQNREFKVIAVVRRFLPTTETFVDGKLIVRVDGRVAVTPMLLALAAIGFADLLFALDSIPAIYGLTREPYIVFAANAFALMGLRQLYFLIGGLLDRLVYLSRGLSVILAFIGVKLVLQALAENSLPFINGGRHVPVPEIPTLVSLAVIAAILAVTTAASLAATRVSDGRQ